jgi:DNA repair exonuclease SbcCD ATPase subunit
MESLDELKYKIKRLQEFQDTLAATKERYRTVEYIRSALSPTTGIPLLFVQVYLQQTRDIANRLLDIAYHGRFYIEDFELTDTDFYIKIIKDHSMAIQDVTLTSQGEMSLISLAFNFALIEQSKKGYNVILLDEVDKELDSDNRRAFVDIIEQQLESMGIEQCCVISHNQEFDTSDLDLILLDGHTVDTQNAEYMRGKTVIYEN